MSKEKSIKCPNCGAPLNILGGGRVNSITCSYCKSVIDLNDNNRVVATFLNRKFSNSLPYEIGTQGKIKDIEYTVIGNIVYREVNGEFEWSDSLLFSPLYGYAWLSYSEGKTTYSKRIRNYPNLSWSELKGASSIKIGDIRYRFTESYRAKIVYVEGELTWVAKYGDVVGFIEFKSSSTLINVENSGTEIEYYKEESYEGFASKESLKDISIDDNYFSQSSNLKDSKDNSNYIIKNNQNSDIDTVNNVLDIDYENSDVVQSNAKIFDAMFIIIVAFLIVAIYMKLDSASKESYSFVTDNNGSIEKSISIKSDKYITQIDISSKKYELNNLDIKIKKDGKTFFILNSNFGEKFDLNSGKSSYLSSWEKSAKSITIYLKFPNSGIYTFSISPKVGYENSIISPIDVKIYNQKAKLNLLYSFLLIVSIIYLIYAIVSIWRDIGSNEYSGVNPRQIGFIVVLMLLYLYFR